MIFFVTRLLGHLHIFNNFLSVLFRKDLDLINYSPCSMECEKFDLVFVTERFKSALTDDDDVLLDLYLEAFREILKFVVIVIVLEFFIN